MEKEVKQLLQTYFNDKMKDENIIKLDKEKSDSSEMIGKSISALSNQALIRKENFGILILNSIDFDEIKLKSLIPQLMRIKELRLSEFNEKNVKIFLIGSANPGLPIFFQNIAYMHQEENIKPLGIEEFEIIRYRLKGEDWSANVSSSAQLSDLDKDALRSARTAFKSKHLHLEREVELWDDKRFLINLGLLKSGKLTNAALLLFGKENVENLFSPQIPKISWILKDANGVERGYQHFGLPYFTILQKVISKINNTTYDYSADTDYASTETKKYDPKVLRELILNGIIHHNYHLSGAFVITEFPDYLIFANKGTFGSFDIQNIFDDSSVLPIYQNSLLANAMCKLNMVDLIGGGIRRVLNIQRSKNFPLPDFDSDFYEVKVKLYGKVLNKNYTEKLVEQKGLTLKEVYYLDQVQKRNKITPEAAELLRAKKLVSGRYPELLVSDKANLKDSLRPAFVPRKVYSNLELKQIILDYLSKNKQAGRGEIDALLLDKLPESLDLKKKRNKIKNLLFQMSRTDFSIKNAGPATKPIWVLSD